MSAGSRLAIRGVPFRFNYHGPRLRAALLVALMLGCLWYAAHPRAFDVVRSPGQGKIIDLAMQSLPDPLRIAACLATMVYFLYMLLTYYVPCLRHECLIIFDGREVRGFRTWGRRGSLLASEIERVTYRGRSAVVRGGTTWLWLPLSMMDMTHTQLQAIRNLLKESST